MKKRAPGQRSANGLSRFRNERGSVLALVTLLLIAFLGLAALAIDLGLLYVARGEAQRAADAAAHAGAGYWMVTPNATDQAIKEEAVRVGELNLVRGGMVSIELDDVEVLRDERKVRASVYRNADRDNPVQTLFARAIGFNDVGVAALAAAQIWPADGVECLLPFAAPDRWWIGGDPNSLPGPTDSFDSSRNDLYIPYAGNEGGTFTGYSQYSHGTEIQLYGQHPHDGTPQPGWWYPFTLVGTSPSAPNLAAAIRGCLSDDVYRFGEDLEVDTNPGAMVNQIKWAFEDLIDEDPTAEWSTSQNCVIRPPGNRCIGTSPRIRPIALFDPRSPPPQGHSSFNITNFVGVFIDRMEGNNPNNFRVIARFINFTTLHAADEWHDGDSPLQMLRIVE